MKVPREGIALKNSLNRKIRHMLAKSQKNTYLDVLIRKK